MSAENSKSRDYQTLSPTGKKNGNSARQTDAPETLTSRKKESGETTEDSTFSLRQNESRTATLTNPQNKPATVETLVSFEKPRDFQEDKTSAAGEKAAQNIFLSTKAEKKKAKDFELLTGDNWIARNGHTLTYFGLYLFSVMVLFRPYELIPGLGFLSATAFYIALATLLIYIPTQFTTEGNLTILTTEVKAVLAMVALALLTMPVAKDFETAWKEFNDPYIKAVLFFLMMVNVVRTRRRLMGMIWLSLSAGVVFSYIAIGMYMRGEMKVEDYRVGLNIGGMFGNPNEFSLHLVMMIPLAIALMFATRSKLLKIIYLTMALLMLFANMITYSRGGFLGIIAATGLMAWKLGRGKRFTVSVFAGIGTILMLFLAPNNFGLRILSIFIPGLDGVGSSDQRRALLERSIFVTLRNPWGIGIGNFPIVGIQNLVTHNAYTQVSSELGILGLIAYLILLFSPFRKLAAIDRTLFAKNELNWFYYVSVGLQASMVAYLVGSFFASVAYYWFIYYLIAYIVAFRRIFYLENNLSEAASQKYFRQKQTI